jgi:hypothetical protein
MVQIRPWIIIKKEDDDDPYYFVDCNLITHHVKHLSWVKGFLYHMNCDHTFEITKENFKLIPLIGEPITDDKFDPIYLKGHTLWIESDGKCTIYDQNEGNWGHISYAE